MRNIYTQKDRLTRGQDGESSTRTLTFRGMEPISPSSPSGGTDCIISNMTSVGMTCVRLTMPSGGKDPSSFIVCSGVWDLVMLRMTCSP